MDENVQSKDKIFAEALRTGDLEAVKRLINSSQHPVSPTTTSISSCFPLKIRFTYNDEVRCDPLAVAAMFSHPNIVSYLLSVPQVINIIDAPTHNLCQCLYDPVDPRAFVNPNIWQDPPHWTALHLAICQGGYPEDYNNSPAVEVSPPNAASSLRILKNLLEAGASLTVSIDQPYINQRDQGDITILHTAALKGRVDILSYLLAGDSEFPRKAEIQALINARDRKGRTPLHYAALRYSSYSSFSPSPSPDSGVDMKDTNDQERHPPHPVIDLLLSAGADLHARDRYSHTPFTLALSFGCYSSARILFLRGAQDNFPLWFPHSNNLCFPLQVLAYPYEVFFLSGTPAPEGPVSRKTWEEQRADLLVTRIRITPPLGITHAGNDVETTPPTIPNEIEGETLHPLFIAAIEGSNPCSIIQLVIDYLQRQGSVDVNDIRCGSTRWRTPLHGAVTSKASANSVRPLRMHPDYHASSGCMRQGEDPRWMLLPQDQDQQPGHGRGPGPVIHSQRELHQWAAVLKCVELVSRGAHLRTINWNFRTPLDLAIHRSETGEGGDPTYHFVRCLLFNLILPHKRAQGQQSLLDAEDEWYLAEKLRKVVVTNPSLALAMATAGVSTEVYWVERQAVLREAEEMSLRTSVASEDSIGESIEGEDVNGGGLHVNGSGIHTNGSNGHGSHGNGSNRHVPNGHGLHTNGSNGHGSNGNGSHTNGNGSNEHGLRTNGSNGHSTHANGHVPNGNGFHANGNGSNGNGSHANGARGFRGDRQRTPGPYDAIQFMDFLLFKSEGNLEVAVREAFEQGLVLNLMWTGGDMQ